MSSTAANQKAGMKSPTTYQPATATSAHATAASTASTTTSRAPTMTMASPSLAKSSINPPTSPSYFSEKHSPEDHTIEIHESPPDETTYEVPPTNPLHLFHAALGIPPPKPEKPVKPTKKNPNPDPPPPKPKLTPANKGVYHQVLTNERAARYKYYFCDGLITVALFLQIIVGASVTAFGAGSASHVLITCFGAANTALASLLAVLKSQGLPNRIRQDWNGWRELREYIEEKEREIEMIVSGRVPGRVQDLDVWEMVKGIERRYTTARLTMEANRPDTYIKVPPQAVLPK